MSDTDLTPIILLMVSLIFGFLILTFLYCFCHVKNIAELKKIRLELVNAEIKELENDISKLE